MAEKQAALPSYFTPFQSSIEGIALPEQFAYPFYYEPHDLALIAARELQDYLQTQTDYEHNFGIEEGKAGLVIGKMFGVLVVQTKKGELGYINAVSGKLAGHNQHEKFVPPVFDMLLEDGFYKKGEAIVSEINERIERLEQLPAFISAEQAFQQGKQQAERELNELKAHNKQQKEARRLKRFELEQSFQGEELEAHILELNKQSIFESYRLKDLTKQWKEQVENLEQQLAVYSDELESLKEERRSKSAALQNEIFDQYYFYDQQLNQRSLGDIFKNTPEGKPTAGAGECAAPKLLQYAFIHGLKPVCMAEFWWGQSPKSEIRIHGHYYPACRGKCEPILGHMLQGMNIAENPMLTNPAEGKELSIVWEDEHLVIINKPAEFLSVPGKNIDDSVLSRLQVLYPKATGPLVVHRLDMSTSGLLIAAKTLAVHKQLQRQFIKRVVKKRYVALLEGIVEEDEGFIDLPLRVDLEDRPRQLVCYEHGKPAQTKWKVIERKDGRTKIHFFPITGRTHQLRVHAAHPQGLNRPIVGDDLYGKRSSRLLLHAEWIEFRHPITHAFMAVELEGEF